MGRPAAAVAHMERGRALYDRERHAAQTFSFAGHDPGACCRYFLAQTHWLLGRPDQALALLREALRLAEELKHPLTTALTHWFACWLHHHRGETDAASASAARLLALVDEYGFDSWAGIALVAALVDRPEPPTLEEITDVWQRLPATSAAAWRRVACFCMLAERYGDAGHPVEGLKVLASIGEADRQAFYAPEVYRLEGELLLQRRGASADDAERRFLTALHLARGRGEKSLELRAAMSLARLLAARDRGDDARAVLAPVYGWFTEGFGTADLVEAKALLARLPGA
jgi:tetratricopeptide (TPR) repeat protein